MTEWTSRYDLSVAPELIDFVEKELLPGLGLLPEQFWQYLSMLQTEFFPLNDSLLKERQSYDEKINDWLKSNKQSGFTTSQYLNFLQSIGYIEAEPDDFTLPESTLDPEVQSVPGPQIVAPLNSSRYALSAVNSRWSSLYDALYDSDLIQTSNASYLQSDEIDTHRLFRVIEYSRGFLDRVLPLVDGSHKDVRCYWVENAELRIKLNTGKEAELIQPVCWQGYTGSPKKPSSLVFLHHGLYLSLEFDDQSEVGKIDPASVKDISLESSLSVLMDSEDSVASVDVGDKLQVYKNWLGLMKGNLEEIIQTPQNAYYRRISENKQFLSPEGLVVSCRSQALMMLRLVGSSVSTGMIKNQNNRYLPDEICDSLVFCTAALHDLRLDGHIKNTATDHLYFFKPKLNNPKEVQYTCSLFERIEHYLSLDINTIRLGLIDEEQRMSLNLKSCLEVAKDRIFALCVGDLDRSADCIAHSIEAGAVMPGSELLESKWLKISEKRSIDIALSVGFRGHGQIVQGMWLQPDHQSDMMNYQSGRAIEGFNATWVSSPKAAALEAMNYHFTDIIKEQQYIETSSIEEVDETLVLPLLRENERIQPSFLQEELDHHTQIIISYLYSWIESGIGCFIAESAEKELIIEDKALVRLSVQFLKNWLYHEVCTKDQILSSLRRVFNVIQGKHVDHNDLWQQSLPYEAFMELIFSHHDFHHCYIDSILQEKRQRLKNQIL